MNGCSLHCNAFRVSATHEGGHWQMDATINATRVVETAPQIAVEGTEVSEAMQTARHCMLEESLGLIFGVLTVGYIVLSLAGLAP